MLIFLYKSGYETGEALAELLANDERLLGKVIAESNPHKCKFTGNDLIIRWGNTKKSIVDHYGMEDSTLNRRESILRSSNKLNALMEFKKHGLNVPRIWENKYEITQFPVLGRDIHHYGGKDIVIINGNNNLKYNNFENIPNKDFYIELIKSINEYRVHVFRGKAIRVTQKVFRGYNRLGQTVENKGLIKNDTYGWGHKHVELDNLNPLIISDAIKSLEILGLTFGAVDVIEDIYHKPYVLEVNTAPRLNTVGLEEYVETFIEEYLRLFPSVTSKKRKYFWE